MAKKKKDKIEDNDDLNKEKDENFNDADDSFGLPDVDYEPIDRTRDEGVSSDDEIVEDDAYTTEEETVYYQPEPDREEPAYIPGSYKPPKDDSSAAKIIGVIVIILLLGAAVWYFGFYRKAQQAEKAQIEQQRRVADAKRIKDAQDASRERQRLADERAAQEAAVAEEAKEVKPTVGEIKTISSRTGRYYVVVASAIDGDLAMDHAKKMSKDGVSINIIAPFGKSKFHRVAIEGYDTWAEAQNSANALKGKFGEGLWVIKY